MTTDADHTMQEVIAAHVAAYHPGEPCPEDEQGRCAVSSTDPDIWMTTESINRAQPPRPACHVCGSPCSGGVTLRWFGAELKPVCVNDRACFRQWKESA